MLTGSGEFATQVHGTFSSDAAPAATAWRRRAWGLAMALAAEGHFSWEDLRQALLEEPQAVDDDWTHCQRWLNALARVASSAGLIDAGLLAELGHWADRAAAREHA
jgi:hypothetical protein